MWPAFPNQPMLSAACAASVTAAWDLTGRPHCAVIVARLEELHERGVEAVVVYQDDRDLLGWWWWW